MPDEHDTLRTKATRGTLWVGLSAMTTQVVRLVVVAVLARLLVPADFGLVGMALLVTGLVAIMGEIGFGAALIQKQKISEEHRSTMFWSSLSVGALCWGIAAAGAPLAAWFFDEPRVTVVIAVLGSAFLIQSLGRVQKSLFHRDLDFRRTATSEVAAAMANGVVSITAAIAGFGVWSLVMGFLVDRAVDSAVLWRLHPWRPRAIFDRESFKQLFGFGANVWGFAFVNYARSNMDFMLVGRLLGSTQLGLYTVAFNLSDFGRNKLAQTVSSVAFPAFSRAQDDNARLRTGYVKIVSYIGFVVFPVMIGLAVVAPEFVGVVYGPKWTAMILPLQILCVAGFVYAIASTVGSVYLAKGRPDIQFKLGIVWLVVLTVFVYVGAQFGIVGVASAVTAYAVSTFFVSQAICNHLIDLPFKTFGAAVAPSLACAGTMGAVVEFVRLQMLRGSEVTQLATLIVSIVAGIVVYIVLVLVLRVPAAREIARLVWEASGPRTRRAMARLGMMVGIRVKVEPDTVIRNSMADSEGALSHE